MACARADLILVNVNPAFLADELAYCLNKVGVKALVLAESLKKINYVDILRKALHIETSATSMKSARIPSLQHVVVLSENKIPGAMRWKDLLAIGSLGVRDELQERESHITFEDVANIQFTSGTTGYPKAVTLSHHSILNNGQYIAEALEATPDDKLCITVPLYHCFGMVMGNLVALNSGATMVYPNGFFDPKTALQAVSKYGCTALYGVPTMFTAMLSELKNDNYKVSTLRTGLMAGSVCPEPLIKKLQTDLNLYGLCVAYGMTETAPVSTLMRPDTPLHKRSSTVGTAGPMVEVKLVDENGKIVPIGEKGEVCVRGYLNMIKYWEDEEKTNETKRNGWVHSGDIGVIDEDGYLSIVGRSKDMIIRGGENISPKEVEEFFGNKKWVKDIQVIGVKDEKFVEEVAAWIIPDRDVKDPQEVVRDLLAMTEGKLAHFKIPRYIYLCDQFPLTVTGKVKKNVMRDEMNVMLE